MLTAKPKKEAPLGRPGCRRENTEMILEKL
jgi:hypothetical protein